MTDTSTPGSNALSPGKLDNGTGSFVLDIPGWLAVQCYVTSGMHLPVDEATMRAHLPADPPGGMDQFKDLVAAYKAVHDHCQTWNDQILPDAVSCAADVVHYNEKVPLYYGALKKYLPALESPTPDPEAVKAFKAILDNLSTQAEGYAKHAAAVQQGMKDFADKTAQDQLTLQPLNKRYADLLGDQSPVIKNLSDQLTQDRSDLQSAQDEYNHDVIVAATSAAYAWVWPFGTIAAGIVAGIYGKKATDALARVKGLQAAIGVLSNQLQAASILLLDLNRIHGDLSDISGKLAAALPVLQQMEGAWTAIASDLNHIVTLIDTDIRQVPAIIKSLGIDEAISAWAAVAKEADVYRQHAFITVTTPEKAAPHGLALKESIDRLTARANRVSGTLAA